ncbi:putative MFS monocarboxylate transporter [Naviculisporaceae sp. PSN 640]
MDSSKTRADAIGEGITTPGSPTLLPSVAGETVTIRACLTVLGGSLSLFCSVGFTNAFGIFQEYYKSHQLQDYSESDISWIGSVSIFLTYILSPVVGVLVDRYGPMPLVISGSILQIFSMFMISLCTEYYQFFLAQAVVSGVGTCFLTLPPMTAVSRTLPSHRGLVIGIVVAGSSIGGIIWPIMLERLLSNPSLSFGWVMRIVGFTMLPLLLFASITIRDHSGHIQKHNKKAPAQIESSESDSPSTPSHLTKPSNRWSSSVLPILKSPTFLLLSTGLAISYLGTFLPFFYIVSYATSSVRGLSPDIPSYLAAIINAASLFGRTVPGHLADRGLGHFNLLIAAVFLSGVIGFTWTCANTLAGLVIWCLAYGFTSGAILSLQSACAGKIVGLEKQGVGMGLVMGGLAVTSLVGGPIGGTLVADHGYLGLSMFTGATMIAGSLLVGAARLGLNKKLCAAV